MPSAYMLFCLCWVSVCFLCLSVALFGPQESVVAVYHLVGNSPGNQIGVAVQGSR